VRHGKGVILASMHFGNTELLMQVPALFDAWQFALLVEKMADSRIYEIVSRIRASQGMSMIAVDEPLKIIRFLKQQGVIGIAVDRDVTGSGIVVNFFGKPARIPDGAVRLAQRTGALIVPAYGWRAQQRQTHIQVLPPLQLTRTDDPTHDTLVNTRKLVEVFEPIVKTHAGQWMAFHPIFDF
jgi:KDO2-lipid IV(A) lauroyltransferase